MSAQPVARPFDRSDLVRVLGRPPSREQFAVVTAPLEPRVVVAGAGSGKTATMVARVLWLVGRGLLPPDGVLGLTFTTKASDELAQRVRVGLRTLAQAGHLPRELADLEPTVSTYHAYAARLVRDHALRAGCEPGAQLVTPATSWQLAARAVASHDGPMDAVTWTEATVVGAVLQLAGELSEHLVESDDVRRAGERLQAMADACPKLLAPARAALTCQRAREQLLPVVERYARAKRERALLDFGDVVALAARIARDAPAVGAAERSAFPLVLLDEYQDTGTAQEVLLSSLFAGHAVTAVGDPCQSIYGWRGASAGALRRFAARFAAPDSEPLPLSTSYRNGGRVLTLANAVSAPLRAEGVPVPQLAAAPGRESSGLVRCALLVDVDAEAEWVAAQVVAEVERLGPEDGRLWSRAAVLCRKRSLFPRLRTAFERRGVPVEVVGLGGLLDVPEVADVVATLQVLDDPSADAALLRLLTGPRWRIGPRDLVVLGRHARALVRGDAPLPDDPVDRVVVGADDRAGSLVDALDDLPPSGLSQEGRRRLTTLRGELRSLRARLDAPLPDLVADVERTLGLDVEVGARAGAADPLAARADLDAFADAAAAFAGSALDGTVQDGAGQAVLSAFLAHLVAVREEENGLDLGTAGGADTVKLVTVHAAKGLEWAVVAVPGLARSASAGGSAVFPAKPQSPTTWTANARLLPFPLRGDRDELPRLAGLDKESLASFLAANAERDAREERRLFYVAATRAEHVLLCSGFHWGEGRGPVGPSEFLLAARAACEQGAGEVDVWIHDPPEDNPVTAGERVVAWPSPVPPAGAAVQAAADRVRALVRAGVPADDLPLRPEDAAAVASWDDDLRRLADEQRRAAARRSTAVLPSTLSVSALVDLRHDPGALAAQLVRPMPRRPAPVARRGTAFHAWLEHTVYGAPQLLDDAELPGAADDTAGSAPDLAALQEAFRRSAWWGRTPVEVEVPFETALAGVVLRGRMDAVFAADLPGGGRGWEVVDWKTGAPPTGAAAQAAAVQLAAYRLAWSRLSGAPLETVSAAFHHVRDDVTVRPADLLDAEGLESLLRAVPQVS